MFHRAAQQGVTAATEDVAVIVVEDGGGCAGGPPRCGPLAPPRVALEPVAAQPGLALVGRALLQPVDRSVVERERRNAGAPEPDVDAGGLRQGWGERLVQVARPH